MSRKTGNFTSQDAYDMIVGCLKHLDSMEAQRLVLEIVRDHLRPEDRQAVVDVLKGGGPKGCASSGP